MSDVRAEAYAFGAGLLAFAAVLPEWVGSGLFHALAYAGAFAFLVFPSFGGLVVAAKRLKEAKS